NDIPTSDELRAIPGNFPPGSSGSPYIGSANGHPVVLGVVTNSLPTQGLPMVGGGIVYSAAMLKTWVEKSWSTLQGNAFSLVFLTDSLVSRFDASTYVTQVSSLFDRVAQKNYLSDSADRGE